MSTQFSGHFTEEGLVKLLRDGFGNGLAKTLADELVNEFKRDTAEKLKEAEARIREQVKHVVEQYALKMVSINQDFSMMKPVVHIVIEHRGDSNV